MREPYQIALDPALNLDAAAFIADWNASEEAQQIGRVAITEVDRSMFGLEAGILILQTANSVAAGLLGKVLYDYIKKRYYIEAPSEPEVIIQERIIIIKEKA